ncbi:MAG: pilin [Candidatus Kerfeldbacteria bacterium]
MKKYLTKTIFLTVIFSIIFFTIPFNHIAQAAEAICPATGEPGYCHYATGWEIIPHECIDPKSTDKNCDLNSFIQLFINLANIMLKLITPLAMIIIIYGGYQFVTARGKQEQIQQGKKVLGGVFIGMVIIVIGGWVISYFVIQTLVGGYGKDQETSLFNSSEYIQVWKTEWWNPGEASSNQNGQQGASGSCYVPGVGCKDNTKNECDPITTSFGAGDWTQGQACDNITGWLNFKDNHLIGTSCCTTGTLPLYDSCDLMNDNYCLDFPGSVGNTNQCGILGGCAL